MPAHVAGICFGRRNSVNLSLLLVAAGCLIALALQTHPIQPFQSHSKKRTGSFRIEASLELAFPLFTPEGEKAWAAGWNPEYVFPADGRTTQGMVFRTHHSGPKTWLMTLYDAEHHRADYANFSSDLLIQVSVHCSGEGNSTVVEVSYVHTALTENGNKLVDEYTQARHDAQMQHWKQSIDDAMKSGNVRK
jgi:hypothetical protein